MATTCLKRQRNVTKTNEGEKVFFRCLNTQCPRYRATVSDEECAICMHKKIERPIPECKKKRDLTKDIIPKKERKSLVKEIKDLEKGELELKEYPKFGMQLANYKMALTIWNQQGRPTRSKEEVEEIYSKHCSKCDWFDAKQKRCRGCGCKVTTGGLAVFNKIKMATEHCPKDLW